MSGKVKAIIVVVLAILFLAAITGQNPSDLTPTTLDAEATGVPTETTAMPVAIATEATTATTTTPATESETIPASEDPEGTETDTLLQTSPTSAAASPAAPPATEPEENMGQDYVLSTNTMKFHYTHCSSAGQIAEYNKAFYHGTRDELIARGYEPCRRCEP